jgi:glutamine cyclotransferase
MKHFFAIFFMAVTILSCGNAKVKEYKLEVVAEYPHDTDSYTQGLFFDEGQMYESTGQYGLSTFRKVDLQTGKALQRLDFNDDYFVEGSVMFKGNLYVLTWTSRKAFVYDAQTLEYKSTWKYTREGWSLTHDRTHLIA